MTENLIEPPTNVTRTYTQKMVAGAKDVFPLLCPVRELDWVNGWPLIKAYTNSGLAEQDCVFITKNNEKENSIWMITRHNPNKYFVEMVKITPSETACKLRIQLTETSAETCDATISYTHVALTDKGKEFVGNFTEDFYASMMKNWEDSINDFLSSSLK